MVSPNVIHWFRQDLRLSDNPAFVAASDAGNVLPIYILDEINSKELAPGKASRIWLHHSLNSLKKSLSGHLSIYKEDPLKILINLCSKHKITDVFWNRCYEPWRIERDKEIKKSLMENGINVHTFNGSLLWEPWDILKSDGTPYKVFTPFYRKGCLQSQPPREPLDTPEKPMTYNDGESLAVSDLSLIEDQDHNHKLLQEWNIGENGAHERLSNFLEHGIENYKKGRDFPAEPYVSGLSPHIHIGEISPNQIWHAIKSIGDDAETDHFCSELGWREFSYSQLYFNPSLPVANLQKKFDAFPWHENKQNLKAWQQGMTGVPMVDAGMRQLLQTGYMHNRVRMIVGSFLVKNLLLHWHHGERWFWDHLVDADLASNSASWQWVAGCGADAAPYFRIFNPVTQGNKFDPEGKYIKKYIPELANLPIKYLFAPWEEPADILEESGVKLGDTYPHPVVDLKESRQTALDAFASLKKEAND